MCQILLVNGDLLIGPLSH
uniref:Uncharacterized protein n=1 Tax=Arundo donax TaxID=35708 RepID=A0A0A9AQT6_ARUDO